MLGFAVYDEKGPAKDWPIDGAYLVGPDDLAAKGLVRFDAETGAIVCQKRGSRATALSLLYDAGSMGRLMLQTCLLPDRGEPYILSVELARHRIKMFIAKSEEWQMFDLSSAHPAMQHWEKARQLFTEAVNSDDCARADRMARRSLEVGIEATERLALAHAEILLHRRFATKAAPSSTLGVRISPGRDSGALRQLVQRDFDIVAIPLNWRELEVEEGRYNWEPVDRWMQWAKEQGKPIVAGPLLDFSKRAVPDWMYVWQNDYDTCRDLAYDHVERVVQRYRSTVGIWNVASGINTNENFRFTGEQMIDLVRMAGLIVRHSRKGARVLVEIAQPFGEHGSLANDSVPPFTFIDRLVQEGIRMDALGVQLMCGSAGPDAGEHHSLASRDLMQFSNLLDKFFLIEIPLLVSAMGAPSEMSEAGSDDPGSSGLRSGGGWWRGNWSHDVQSRWAGQMFAIAMSKPFVESAVWCELYDHAGSMLPASGLITQDGRAKPALSKLINVRKRLRKPLGPLKLPSKAQPPAVT